MFDTTLSALTGLTCVSQYLRRRDSSEVSTPFNLCPGLVFDYTHDTNDYGTDEHDIPHWVYYRPALLHNRHIVDVIRAICGPADVCEAELDLVSEEATDAADIWGGEGWEGVWFTCWEGPAITAQG